jgi:hypothetical protein
MQDRIEVIVIEPLGFLKEVVKNALDEFCEREKPMSIISISQNSMKNPVDGKEVLLIIIVYVSRGDNNDNP